MGAVPNVFFIILLLLGLASIASIVLPRAAAAGVAIAGFIVTSASYVYLFVQFEQASATSDGEIVRSFGVDWIALPHIGSMLAGFCYLVIILLQLIPFLNKPLVKR